MEETQEPIVVNVDENLSAVKGAILNLAQANNSPAVGNTTRQVCDCLDQAYAMYRMLLGIVQSQNQQVDEKIASGDVVQFPTKAAQDA